MCNSSISNLGILLVPRSENKTKCEHLISDSHTTKVGRERERERERARERGREGERVREKERAGERR